MSFIRYQFFLQLHCLLLLWLLIFQEKNNWWFRHFSRISWLYFWLYWIIDYFSDYIEFILQCATYALINKLTNNYRINHQCSFIFQAVINSTVTPNMVLTKTSQKFGQWADPRANTIYGLGFGSEADLAKVRLCICFMPGSLSKKHKKYDTTYYKFRKGRSTTLCQSGVVIHGFSAKLLFYKCIVFP